MATTTAEAAYERLETFRRDPTLAQCMWVLARIANGARSDFAIELSMVGVNVDRASTGLGFVAEVGRVLRVPGAPMSLLSEHALKSLQKVLTARIVDQSQNLFGSGIEDVRSACSTFSTDVGFGSIVRDFYAEFMSRTLRGVIDKELSNHIGPGRSLLDVDSGDQFSRDVDRYCRETSKIVEAFAAGWYSKQNWKTGGKIDQRRASAFASHALTKLQQEFRLEAKTA